MSTRLTLARTLVGALLIIIAFAYSQSPPLAPTVEDTGPRHYTVDKPECVVDDTGTDQRGRRRGAPGVDLLGNG